ncbi:MAG: NAD(P)-dependent glycerol-3-phosphate dehydrogenase [Rhodospirillaceae bacterium]|jgi:glycerol-3-phosphate dehydrogenase (NAD(P)+)|nr:NAD(P)-dependent glycerol-3-phosphate dehydrogenase [Rhodospirillaceae bacterium]MBT6119079.1 NAD(P)-dependent glycerol-3-phosphate dehydrogenase [Rhodospirillaceae bacterium]
MQRIGIIGGGAWGTALAAAARRAGRDVLLWARESAVVEAINARHANPMFLPGVDLDPAIRATGDLAEAAARELLLLVVPAQHLRETAAKLAPHAAPDTPVAICAKGIEQGTGALMSEALADALPGRPPAVLSGPTFAAEVARGLPTALTLASADPVLGERIVGALHDPYFRLYRSDDPVGAQIGGALKNVIAIACGISDGRRLGDNARAALLTRGASETTRFALALGAKPETMMGLAGIGDLALTCMGAQSRNRSLGFELGEGRALADILEERNSVAEGMWTAASVLERAARLGVEMPIAEAVDAIVNAGADIDETIRALLSRPAAAEAPWARG